MHRLVFVGVPFVHMPTRIHQGWVKEKWLRMSTMSTLQEKRWETRNSLQNQPPPQLLMNRCHSVPSHPTNTPQEDFFSPTHGNADTQMQTEQCAACPAQALWTPSRLGTDPVAPLPFLPLRNTFQRYILREVQGALAAGLTANLGSLCSCCKVRSKSAPTHSSCVWANKPRQVAGWVCWGSAPRLAQQWWYSIMLWLHKRKKLPFTP